MTLGTWIRYVVALAAVVIAAVFGTAANADNDPIAVWTFEPEPFLDADGLNLAAGPSVTPSTGTGSLSGLHASAATDWTTPTGNGSANAYSSNTWADGDYYQFQ